VVRRLRLKDTRPASANCKSCRACSPSSTALIAKQGSPEHALEGGSGEAGIHEDVVGHERRPLLHGVEQNAVDPFEPIAPKAKDTEFNVYTFRERTDVQQT